MTFFFFSTETQQSKAFIKEKAFDWPANSGQKTEQIKLLYVPVLFMLPSYIISTLINIEGACIYLISSHGNAIR